MSSSMKVAKGTKDPQIFSGITGWGAARKVLDGCADEVRRLMFKGLVVNAGVKGAPAMEYVARLLRWHGDNGTAPAAPAALRVEEVRYCERRARELIQPYENDRRMALPLRAMTDDMVATNTTEERTDA